MNIYTVKVKQGELMFQTDLPAISSWKPCARLWPS